MRPCSRTSCFLVLLLAGCAAASSQGDSTAADEPAEVRIGTRGGTRQLSIRNDRLTSQNEVPVTRERVWVRLPAVYRELGLPVGVADSSSYVLRSGEFRVRRKLGDALLASYVDCGTTQGGLNANSYDIVLDVTTELLPASDGGTALRVQVNATGRPMGVSNAPVNCSSFGRLERKLAEGILKPPGD